MFGAFGQLPLTGDCTKSLVQSDAAIFLTTTSSVDPRAGGRASRRALVRIETSTAITSGKESVSMTPENRPAGMPAGRRRYGRFSVTDPDALRRGVKLN